MAKYYMRRKIILAIKEVTYGTDPVPTEALNAIRTLDFEFDPFEAENIQVNEDKPEPGSDEEVLVGRHGVLRFGVFLSGAGTPGDVPPLDPLVTACGYEGAEDLGVSYTYTQVFPTEDSLTFYTQIDGKLHKFVGSRGSFEIVTEKRGFPRINFTFMGLFVPVEAGTLDPDAVDKSAWLKAVPFRAATVDVSLHGQTVGCHSLTVTSGEETEFYEHSDLEEIVNSDRSSRYQMRFEEPDIGDFDYWERIGDEEIGALNYTHGTSPGNIVEVNGSQAQITSPSNDDEQGIVALSVEGPLVANSSNSYKALELIFR